MSIDASPLHELDVTAEIEELLVSFDAIEDDMLVNKGSGVPSTIATGGSLIGSPNTIKELLQYLLILSIKARLRQNNISHSNYSMIPRMIIKNKKVMILI